ncbi:hypothetical protein E2320_012488 [Naja naja]|nr:hypothetical protein E2320_012488 [Naja naja]
MVLLIAGGVAVTWPGATEHFGFLPPSPTKHTGLDSGRDIGYVERNRRGREQEPPSATETSSCLIFKDPPFSGSLSRVRDCKYVPVQLLLSHPSKTRRHIVQANTPVPLGAAAGEQVVGSRTVCSCRPALGPGPRKGTPATITALQPAPPLDSFLESGRTQGRTSRSHSPRAESRCTASMVVIRKGARSGHGLPQGGPAVRFGAPGKWRYVLSLKPKIKRSYVQILPRPFQIVVVVVVIYLFNL